MIPLFNEWSWFNWTVLLILECSYVQHVFIIGAKRRLVLCICQSWILPSTFPHTSWRIRQRRHSHRGVSFCVLRGTFARRKRTPSYGHVVCLRQLWRGAFSKIKFLTKKNDLRSLLNNDYMMYYFTTLWWHTTPPTLIHNLHWPTPLFHFITIPFFRAKKEDLVDLDRCIDPGLSSIIIVNQHHCDEDTRFRIW